MFDGPDYSAGLNALAVIHDPTPTWRIFAGDDFTGAISGSGMIFGTAGHQDFNLSAYGHTTLDPSFSRGGDTIRLWGTAEVWAIEREGSNAILTRHESDAVSVTIPVGQAGIKIVFGIGYTDDERVLRFDAKSGEMVLGLKEITNSPLQLEDEINLPTSEAVGIAGSARMFLPEGDAQKQGEMQFGLKGNFDIFGSARSHYWFSLRSGNVNLDPSFNRGGHEIELGGLSYLAKRVGSTVVLSSAGAEVTIPVGPEASYISLGYMGGFIRYDIDQKAIVYEKITGVEVIDEDGIMIYSDYA